MIHIGIGMPSPGPGGAPNSNNPFELTTPAPPPGSRAVYVRTYVRTYQGLGVKPENWFPEPSRLVFNLLEMIF